jgi:hypothetical protein
MDPHWTCPALTPKGTGRQRLRSCLSAKPRRCGPASSSASEAETMSLSGQPLAAGKFDGGPGKTAVLAAAEAGLRHADDNPPSHRRQPDERIVGRSTHLKWPPNPRPSLMAKSSDAPLDRKLPSLAASQRAPGLELSAGRQADRRTWIRLCLERARPTAVADSPFASAAMPCCAGGRRDAGAQHNHARCLLSRDSELIRRL